MLFMEEKHLTIASVKAAYQSGEKTPTGLMQEIIEKAKKYSDKNIWIIEPDPSVHREAWKDGFWQKAIVGNSVCDQG